MKWIIWKMPPWAHGLMLKLTGYRLVLMTEKPPDWVYPDYYIEWEQKHRKQWLIWTKKWPL